MEHNIEIKRAVLHVLDTNAGIPVLSKGELEVSEDLAYYLGRHIGRVLDDPNTKHALFTGEENGILLLSKLINDNEEDFLPITSDMADRLFTLMQKNIDIPSAPGLCVSRGGRAQNPGPAEVELQGRLYPWVNNFEDGNINTIIRHQTLLPRRDKSLMNVH